MMVEVLMLWLHHRSAAADLKPYGDIVFMFFFSAGLGLHSSGASGAPGVNPTPPTTPGNCLTGQYVRDGGSDGRSER